MGEPLKKNVLEPPEPKGKLDAETANGPEDETLDWDAIVWPVHEENVRRLRQRIFKATKGQDLATVRNLQRMMLRSWSNTLVSVRQVTQRNAGRGTPGVDGQVALTARARMDLAVQVHGTARSFQPLPVRRVYIPKANGKQRPLGIPAMADRAHQARCRNALEPEWEARFAPRTYGFRPGRSCQDAIAVIHVMGCGKNPRRRWILDADLTAALDPWSNCSFADLRVQNSPSCGVGISIRRPFLRPVRVRTARSSPRLTFCNTVWREMPRARLAWCRASHPSGASPVSMPRS